MKYYQSRCLIIEKKTIKGYKAYSAALYEDLLTRIIDVGSNPIDELEHNYLEQKNLEIAERARHEKVAYIVVLLGLGVVTIAIIVYLLLRYRRKNREILDYLIAIKELKTNIADQSSLFVQLGEVLNGKLEVINSLCSAYYENDGLHKQQEAIFKRVKSIISDIRDGGDYFSTIEVITNQCRDNVLHRLKTELPSLSNDEYKLACYLCAGFSTQAICLFFDCTKEVLYRRTYRLREKIKKSNSSNKDFYLFCM
jgi:hypothetical protein